MGRQVSILTVAILAEKPSASRNFAKALGGMSGTYDGESYTIVASRGHLYEYVDPGVQVPAHKSWRLSDLPWNASDFEWKREARGQVRDVLKTLKAAFAAADEICIATDDDPTGEGELLAWEIIDELGFAHGKNKRFSRMFFEDESAAEVRRAFSERKPIDSMEADPDYVKATYRSQWDFLSMQFTRAATLLGDGCSVLRQGRLKSAMVRLVGDQLDAIDAYEPIPSYSNRFRDENGNVYVSAKEPAYGKREEVPVDQYTRAHVVVDSKTRKRTAPQKLIDLARLSALLAQKGISAKDTLDTYQKLYEAQIASYPRTEDKCITIEQFNEMLPKVDAIAALVGVDSSLLTHREPRPTHVKSGMAHGANRPGKVVPASLGSLRQYGPGAVEIYTVLAKNFLAMFAEDYEYEQQKGHLQEYPDFKGTCNVPLVWGWKAVSSDASDDDIDADAPDKGLGTMADPFVHEGFPPKPAYPTMKWLMTQLEKHDVGTGATRTSTYADVTKQNTKYPLLLEKKGGRIEMTQYGKMSHGLLPGTHIGDLALTERLMGEMRDVADGKLDPDEGLSRVATYVADDIQTMKTNASKMRETLGVTMQSDRETASGTWNGTDVTFTRTFGGHRFTDDEVAALLAGDAITFQATAKSGNPYTAAGLLAKQTYNGHHYVGFKLDFDLVDDSKRPVPDAWCGHSFTADEKATLESGGRVHVDDAVSKKTGKTFSCDVLFKAGRIEPQFESSANGVPASWCGHSFTPQEKRDLEAGRDIHIDDAVSKKTGKTFSCDLVWGEREDGTVGITPSFASGGVPASWCGHTFTAAEKKVLESGENVHIEGAVSKAGKVFSCDVAYEQREDGKMGIVPKFDRR